MARKEPDGWEELSPWYDEKQGETGDLWHRALIDPVLLDIVGDCRRKKVLDLGCGNGYLARRLARRGARVTAVDSSPGMLRAAKSRDPKNALGIRYVRSDASRLAKASGNGFDLVFANMSLMDMEDAEGAISEVSRVLKERGRFVASISHPCFDNGSSSGWVMEKVIGGSARVYRRIRRYRELVSEEFPWKTGEGEKRYTRGFHRPLSWYSAALRSHGFVISRLEEPMPTKEFLEEESKGQMDLDAPGFLEVPLHLVFEAVKL